MVQMNSLGFVCVCVSNTICPSLTSSHSLPVGWMAIPSIKINKPSRSTDCVRGTEHRLNVRHANDALQTLVEGRQRSFIMHFCVPAHS